MDNLSVKAAHEMGHFFFAYHNGFKVKLVTVVSGIGYPPFSLFDHAQSGIEKNIDLWLGGWAAEAYALSHPRGCKSFRPLRFCYYVYRARVHAGWGTGSPTSDIGQLRNAGISFPGIPFERLKKLGRFLFKHEDVFYRLINEIKANYTMSGEWLIAVMQQSTVTDKMRSNTWEILVSELRPSTDDNDS